LKHDLKKYEITSHTVEKRSHGGGAIVERHATEKFVDVGEKSSLEHLH
jgi:hypothetical protein